MKRFLVRAAGEVIGWSHLETGDPAMGVVSGDFHPNDRYRRDKHAMSNGRAAQGLTVTDEDGREVGPNLGIPISDYGPEQFDDPLLIDVLGLDSELYREMFPDQYNAYFGGAV